MRGSMKELYDDLANRQHDPILAWPLVNIILDRICSSTSRPYLLILAEGFQTYRTREQNLRVELERLRRPLTRDPLGSYSSEGLPGDPGDECLG